jgi:hypothetical protein
MQQLKNSTRKQKLKSKGTHSVRCSNITVDLSINTKNHMCKFPETVPLKISDCVLKAVLGAGDATGSTVSAGAGVRNSEISTYGCRSGSSSSSSKENDAAPAQALALKQSDSRAI